MQKCFLLDNLSLWRDIQRVHCVHQRFLRVIVATWSWHWTISSWHDCRRATFQKTLSCLGKVSLILLLGGRVLKFGLTIHIFPKSLSFLKTFLSLEIAFSAICARVLLSRSWMRGSIWTTTIRWLLLVFIQLRGQTQFVRLIMLFETCVLSLINFHSYVMTALSFSLSMLRVVRVSEVTEIVYLWPSPIVICPVHETFVKDVDMAQVMLFNVRQVHLWNVWCSLNALRKHCLCDITINLALVFLIDDCYFCLFLRLSSVYFSASLRL